MSTSHSLGTLQSVPLRDFWEREDTDFTPWLASEDNLALLGKALNMELILDNTEVSVGLFRADILCKDNETQKTVVIENQLEGTDHKHLGQSITYAAGLGATTIVWIAQRFREEHRAAMDWLNNISNNEYHFFGVEMELWKIGDSLPAPKFNLAVQPNDLIRAAREIAKRGGALSPREQNQWDFWNGLAETMLAEGVPFNRPKPRTHNWVSWGLGRSGANIVAKTNQKEVAVRVEFDNHAHPTWFDQAQEQQAAIEAKLKYSLEWERRDNRKFCLLSVKQEIDIRDPNQQPEAYRWILARLSELDEVFRPLVKELTDSHDLR